MMGTQHYLDHNATSPPSPEALAAARPWLESAFGNASSVHHAGRQARHAVDHARAQVASALGASPSEIVFTSGGSEADGLAILGAVRAWRRKHEGAPHVVVSQVEHQAVLRSVEALEREGVRVTRVAPGRDGGVDAAAFVAAFAPSTCLASLMLANNETGVLQPVREVASAARAAGVLMHCDAVQGVGKVPVDVGALGVDLLTVSGHKVGALQGVGALYVRRGVSVEPLWFGGNHERGRRAGTENVAGIVSLGAALSARVSHLEVTAARMAALRDRLELELLERLPFARVNGAGAVRVPNTSSITLQGFEGEALLLNLDLEGIGASSGSACSSGTMAPSHVLLAMGLTVEEAHASLRFSLGPRSTDEDVDAVLRALPRICARLSALSAPPDAPLRAATQAEPRP